MKALHDACEVSKNEPDVYESRSFPEFGFDCMP